MQEKKQLAKTQDQTKQPPKEVKIIDQKTSNVIEKSESPLLAEVLKRHGISKTSEESQRKQKAERFQRDIHDSGLKTAFELVLSELVSKNIPKEDFYVYAKERFFQLGEKFDGFKEKEKNKENKNQPQRAK